MMKNWLFFLLLLPLVTFSCRKDSEDISITQTNYQPPVVLVTGSLSGQVVGPDGTGISNVMVRVGSYAAVTNGAGLYQFRDIQMNARGTYVKAYKQGYFQGSDRLYVSNGSRNVSTIELKPKTNVGSFNGAEGGSVTVGGAQVSLPANGVIDAQNNTYTGTVQVVAAYMNPVANNIADIMPGGLFGVNTKGEEVMMASMGMVAVELQDGAGNELQVAPGKRATLQFTVPGSLLANAPAEIPLWYFDETDGVWIEEGSANLNGNLYVGEVSHFTDWNVDFPTGALVFVNGCFVYDDGSPAVSQHFRIVSLDNNLNYGYGSANTNGEFSGFVPANETIAFHAYDGCSQLQSFSVGPFSDDANLGECFVVNSAGLATLSGQLTDCDGNGVDGGLVQVRWSYFSEVAVTDENGNFSLSLTSCSNNEVSVRGFDFLNSESTETTSYSFTEDLDIGTIAACDNPLVEFINSNVDGEDVSFFLVNLSTDSLTFSPDSLTFLTYSVISGLRLSAIRTTINLYVSDLAPGSYSGNDAGFNYFFGGNNPSGSYGYLDCFVPCSSVTVNITSNGGPGGLLEGNYSGTSDGWDGNQQPLLNVPVSGTFRVRIPQ
jgi:hypothetical protein